VASGGEHLSANHAIVDGADVNVPEHDTLEMALHSTGFDRTDLESRWSLELVRKMLEINVHVNDANILYAIEINTIEIVELLLYHRPAGKLRLRTNEDDEVGPLWALAKAQADTEEKIDLFLDRGEDVNEVCGPGGTALHGAILSLDFSESVAAASYLLERGADPNISCGSGLPLVMAWSYVPDYLRLEYRNWLPEILRLLLSHEARFDPLNAAVATPSEEEMWDLCKLSRGEYVAKYKTEEEVWDLCKLSKEEYIAMYKDEELGY
jgi:hypothetical protein